VLTFGAETVRNWIDSASKQKAGSVTSRDLDRTRLSVGVRRDILVGSARRLFSLSGTASQSWAGGEIYSRDLQVAGQVTLAQGKGGSLWLAMDAERGWEGADDRQVDVGSVTLLGETSIRQGRGRMNLGLTVERAWSDDENSAYNAAQLSLGVDPGWTIGPAAVSFTANAAVRDYEAFVLFGSVFVTGGRQDESWGAGVDFTFDDWGLLGFAPVLSLRHGRTFSNVSRYETSTTGISIGVASVF
jgi:hypothetical protein